MVSSYYNQLAKEFFSIELYKNVFPVLHYGQLYMEELALEGLADIIHGHIVEILLALTHLLIGN